MIAYINAVDKDIHNKKSFNDWKDVKVKYDKAYTDCKNALSIRIQELPKYKSNGWFNGEAGSYSINKESFNEYTWNNLVSRANSKEGYSDFKLKAMSFILKELYSGN